MQAYSSLERERDPFKLPDLEIFELTAREVAEMDEGLVYAYSKRVEYRLCFMNPRVMANMLDAIVEAEDIKGGWFYQPCFPGCLPDGSPVGPYDSAEKALEAAREEMEQC